MPVFPELALLRKVIICPPHRLTLLYHLTVCSEFRKRGAVYWAPTRILETIQFPLCPHTHTYNRVVLSGRSHDMVGHRLHPDYIMFCLAHRESFETNCTNILNWEIACTHQDFWPFLNDKTGTSGHVGLPPQMATTSLTCAPFFTDTRSTLSTSPVCPPLTIGSWAETGCQPLSIIPLTPFSFEVNERLLIFASLSKH